MSDTALDGRVLALTLALSFLTALVFGLVPAIQGAAADPAEALRAGGRERQRRTRAPAVPCRARRLGGRAVSRAARRRGADVAQPAPADLGRSRVRSLAAS